MNGPVESVPGDEAPDELAPANLGSTLVGILSGHDAAQVQQFTSARSVAEIAHTVAGAGWQFGYLDGVAAADKAAVLLGLGEALGFPEHYGRNLDALADCLDDLVDSPGPGVLLLWDAWQILAVADPVIFAIVVQILEEHQSGQRPLAVLLRQE